MLRKYSDFTFQEDSLACCEWNKIPPPWADSWFILYLFLTCAGCVVLFWAFKSHCAMVLLLSLKFSPVDYQTPFLQQDWDAVLVISCCCNKIPE
jgi:hypothetical protein